MTTMPVRKEDQESRIQWLESPPLKKWYPAKLVRMSRMVYSDLIRRRNLGEEQVVESVIRQKLGNTPDVSKSLRLLVEERIITRTGGGGRKEPFKYILNDPSGEGFTPCLVPPSRPSADCKKPLTEVAVNMGSMPSRYNSVESQPSSGGRSSSFKGRKRSTKSMDSSRSSSSKRLKGSMSPELMYSRDDDGETGSESTVAHLAPSTVQSTPRSSWTPEDTIAATILVGLKQNKVPVVPSSQPAERSHASSHTHPSTAPHAQPATRSQTARQQQQQQHAAAVAAAAAHHWTPPLFNHSSDSCKDQKPADSSPSKPPATVCTGVDKAIWQQASCNNSQMHASRRNSAAAQEGLTSCAQQGSTMQFGGSQLSSDTIVPAQQQHSTPQQYGQNNINQSCNRVFRTSSLGPPVSAGMQTYNLLDTTSQAKSMCPRPSSAAAIVTSHHLLGPAGVFPYQSVTDILHRIPTCHQVANMGEEYFKHKENHLLPHVSAIRTHTHTQ